MDYNFLKREVYMPEKHFRKDRCVKLGKHENIFFAVLWFSKDHKAPYQLIYDRVYGYGDVDKKLLISKAKVLRNKGIKVVPIYKYGYKLK